MFCNRRALLEQKHNLKCALKSKLSFKNLRLGNFYEMPNIVGGAFAPPGLVSDVLKTNLSGILFNVLFSVVAATRTSVWGVSALRMCNVGFPCKLLSVDFCVRHLQVCQVPLHVFQVHHRAFTRVICWDEQKTPVFAGMSWENGASRSTLGILIHVLTLYQQL